MRYAMVSFAVSVAAAALLVGCAKEPSTVAWCETDDDCGAGTHCDEAISECVSNCVSDLDCPGQVCNEATGECMPEGDTDTGDDPNPNPDPCGDAVFLIIDRSSSMANDNKWDDLIEHLTGSLDYFADGTAYGLEVFPDGSCTDDYEGAELDVLCREPDNVEVDVANGTVDSIIASLLDLGTCGGTPTSGALSKALTEVAAYDGEVQVVLVTDGAPNCNTDIDEDDCECVSPEPGACVDHPENCLDDADAVALAEALYNAGAPLHVIAFSVASQFADVMDQMAAAGGTEEAVECSAAVGVGNALTQILYTIIEC